MAKAYSTYLRVKFFHDRLMSIFKEMDSVVDDLVKFRASALDVLWDSRRFLDSQESALKPAKFKCFVSSAVLYNFPRKCVRKTVQKLNLTPVVIEVDFSRKLL
jgi:hypothetical protein